jgi:hypothetical protein
VRLAAKQLLRAAAGCPGATRARGGTLACYVQPHLVLGEPRLVLNRISSGMGTGRTRISHLIGKSFAGQRAPEEELLPEQDGVLHAEIEATFGSGLNQRHPAVGHVLSYPGSVSARPPERQISVGDLVVVNDPGSGTVRLEWARTGQEVVPVHLGLLALPLLPPALRLLVGAFGKESLHFHAALLAPRSFLPRPTRDAGWGSRWPRLEVGQTTLRRAGWLLGAAEVPRRAPGERDDAYLLQMARWRRGRGIPERCFIRVFRGPEADQERSTRPAPVPWLRKERKPMFIDFASWHLVQVFERMTQEHQGDVLIEEALPELGDVPATETGERRVVELIVEVPRGPLP